VGLKEIRELKEKALLPKEKKKYYIPKVSEKKKKQIAEQKESGTDNGLDKWFEDRRKEMTGRCCLCNGQSEKKNDETYRRSIHHLLDKRKSMFPSVANHPDNWLELCFYGNSCHQNIHNKTITWELLYDSKEWEMIEAKLKKVFPFVAQSEIKNIPAFLLQKLNPELIK
jgi:hypothetical protein